MKKKRSLVGWTFGNWKDYFNKNYGRFCLPEIYINEKSVSYLDTKIRITIEEVNNG